MLNILLTTIDVCPVLNDMSNRFYITLLSQICTANLDVTLDGQRKLARANVDSG